MVLNRALYVLKKVSNSFHNCFGYFLRDLAFIPSRSDQDLWIRKSSNYEGYDCIATHVDYFIIDAKNTSKYMHDIEMHSKVEYITDSTN